MSGCFSRCKCWDCQIVLQARSSSSAARYTMSRHRASCLTERTLMATHAVLYIGYVAYDRLASAHSCHCEDATTLPLQLS